MDNILRYDYRARGPNARLSEDESLYACELFLERIEGNYITIEFA